MFDRSCEIAAVPFGEDACDRPLAWLDQLEHVDVSIRGEEPREMTEDRPDIGCVEMVQEAVDEDEIKPLRVWYVILGDVDGQKVAVKASPGTLDVCRVDVETEVGRGRVELVRVGARSTPNIEDATYLAEVVVRADRGELAISLGAHPDAVHERLLKQTLAKASGVHHRRRAVVPEWQRSGRIRRKVLTSSGRAACIAGKVYTGLPQFVILGAAYRDDNASAARPEDGGSDPPCVARRLARGRRPSDAADAAGRWTAIRDES